MTARWFRDPAAVGVGKRLPSPPTGSGASWSEPVGPGEHAPWTYTEFGVLCLCGRAMRDEVCPDEQSPADCARCGHPASHHDDGGATCWTDADGLQTEWDSRHDCQCSSYEPAAPPWFTPGPDISWGAALLLVIVGTLLLVGALVVGQAAVCAVDGGRSYCEAGR